MLVLIDESGCAGFKLGRGSSPVFVVAMVIFANYAEAERVATTIAKARSELGVKPEFRFSKCADRARDGFFTALAGCQFRVRAMVVRKERVYSPKLRRGCDTFHSYFVRMLFQRDDGALAGARIKIDGRADREFRRALESHLRHQLGAGRIAKLTFADSRRDNLVQLADMAAGAIARSYHPGRADPDRWLRMPTPWIADAWEFE